MLRECINSFIAQTFKDWELVLVDDGSEDDLTFVSKMDSRIKYIRQPHLGISAAFNLALDNSSGKYIMPFGSDDLATPELLEDMVEHIEKYVKYDVFYSNYWIMLSDGTLQRKLFTKMLGQKDAYKLLLYNQYIPHPASLWRKEKMPRYDETLESAVDWELFLTAMERGVKFKHRRMKLWIYRTGHEREFGSKRQIDCCDRVLRRRGYFFNKETRKGEKICSY